MFNHCFVRHFKFQDIHHIVCSACSQFFSTSSRDTPLCNFRKSTYAGRKKNYLSIFCFCFWYFFLLLEFIDIYSSRMQNIIWFKIDLRILDILVLKFWSHRSCGLIIIVKNVCPVQSGQSLFAERFRLSITLFQFMILSLK